MPLRSLISNALHEDLNPLYGKDFRRDFAFSRQEALLWKKLEEDDPSTRRSLANRAISDFLGVNWRMGIFDAHDLGWKQNSILSEMSCDISNLLARVNLGAVPIEAVLRLSVPGPGTSTGSSGCDFFTKHFEGPLTASSSFVKEIYLAAISSHPSWYAAEKERASRHGDIAIDTPAELLTVPKDCNRRRTIMREPAVNTFLQLGTGKLFEALLARWGLAISRGADDTAPQQFRNRLMAQQGSRNFTAPDAFCTIDLKSASDTVSCSLVRFLFQWNTDWYNWLHSLRSPKFIAEDQVYETKMFSTMGNGFTFPLQTLIFASVVRSCYRHLGLPLRSERGLEYSVYGDDIIVRRDAYDLVCATLTSIGCWVNPQKSFATGPFRESCGGDYWDGYDVRPVMPKKLDRPATVVSLLNRLVRWGAFHGVSLRSTTTLLVNWLRNHSDVVPPLVPSYESDDAGIHVPSNFRAKLPVPRFIRLELFADEATIAYQAMEVQKKSFRLHQSCVLTINSLGEAWFANANSALLSHLGGYAESGRISIRIDRIRYHRRWRVTPCWDAAPASEMVHLRPFDAQRYWQYHASECCLAAGITPN